jgi:hypothetical protein
MIGVAEQCFAIFGGNAGRSQSTRERVAKVMDANQRQSRVASGVLPPLLFMVLIRLPRNGKTQIG